MAWIGDSIVRSAQDLLQVFFWTILNPLISLTNTLLDSLFNGVLGLDIFSSNSFLSSAFACSLGLMFLIIPVKFVYELITCMLKDDDAGLDVQKKLGSAFLGIMIACSLTIGITKIINPLVKDVTQVLLNINLVSTDANGVHTDEVQIGDNLVETILVSFGGLPQQGEYGAEEFIRQYNSGELDIVERYEDDTANHQKFEYKWDVGLFMCIIGVAIYVIMLFVITVQISVRMIAIGFYYIIGPLCCTSMTNYQNPQAFIVWKNTLIGQWVQNMTQILLLALMVSLLNGITQAAQSYPIACACLYFGAFSLTISAPSFVQAMIGGYSAGIMDMLNQFRGGFGMAKSTLAFAIGGAIGRRTPYTGHLQGGVRGAVTGNKDSNGQRHGGMTQGIVGNKDQNGNRQGGLRGAIIGNKDSFGRRQGGIPSAIAGRTIRPNSASAAATNTGKQSNVSSGVERNNSAAAGLNGSMDTSNSSPFNSSIDGAANFSTNRSSGFSSTGTDMSSGTSTTDMVGRTGGVRGMIFGNDSIQHNSDGSVTKTRSGGIKGLAKGSTATTYNRNGERIQSVHKPRMSSLRGSTTTRYNPKTQKPIQSRHNDGSVKKAASKIRNHTKDFKGKGKKR